MRKTLLILFFLLLIGRVEGQNIYSQFVSSPLSINPAHTGRISGNYRIGGTFRNEKKPFTKVLTQRSLFLDGKVLKSITSENDHLAIGVMGLNERSIDEGIKNNYFSMSLSYQKSLNEDGNQQIGIGFQTVFANKTWQPPNLVFEDQLLSLLRSGFSGIDIYRNEMRIDLNYIDLNLGIIYQGVINSTNTFTIGGAAHHMNKPSKSFDGGEFKLTPSIFYHASWEKNLLDNNKFSSVIVINSNKNELEDAFIGCTYQMQINESANYMILGGCLRNNIDKGKVFIPSFGLKFNNMMFNASYDVNISGSKNYTNQKSAAEISLLYVASTKEDQSQKFLAY